MSKLKLLSVSIVFLPGKMSDGTYLRIIFSMLTGNVWYRNRPSILAVRNSEVNERRLVPSCRVAVTCRLSIKYFFSGAVNNRLSTLISPIIWSMEPPLKSAFSFTEISVSSYLGVRFKSWGRNLSTEAVKLKVGTFSAMFIIPFIATEPFGSFKAAFPLNPPFLYSPSRVMFSYL